MKAFEKHTHKERSLSHHFGPIKVATQCLDLILLVWPPVTLKEKSFD